MARERQRGGQLREMNSLLEKLLVVRETHAAILEAASERGGGGAPTSVGAAPVGSSSGAQSPALHPQPQASACARPQPPPAPPRFPRDDDDEPAPLCPRRGPQMSEVLLASMDLSACLDALLEHARPQGVLPSSATCLAPKLPARALTVCQRAAVVVHVQAVSMLCCPLLCLPSHTVRRAMPAPTITNSSSRLAGRRRHRRRLPQQLQQQWHRRHLKSSCVSGSSWARA